MERAGYPEPTSGLGTFKIEIENVSSLFLDGGLYAVKDETGEVVKVATHKLPAIPDDVTEEERQQIILNTAYEYIERLALHNGIAYNTAKKPRRLLQAANSGKEPGEFISYSYHIKRTPDFHVDMDIDGRKYWTPLQEQKLSIQREKGDT